MPSSLQSCDKYTDKANTLIQLYRTPEYDGKVMVLVEGKDDRIFFYKFFDSNCAVVKDCGNCRKVREIADMLLEQSVTVLAIKDSDYDRLENRTVETDYLFCTDKHDYEMMCISNREVRERLFNSLALEADESLINEVFDELRYLSYMKWMNYAQHRNYNFDAYHVSEKSADELKNFEVFHQALMAVSPRRTEVSKEDFEEFVNQRTGVDDYELVVGHDFLQRLAEHIKKLYREWGNLNEKRIRDMLHPNFRESDFEATRLYDCIKEWERQHKKYVLKSLV